MVTRSRSSDAQTESVISTLLRTGVAAASFVVLAGGIYYLVKYGAAVPHYAAFHGEPERFRSVPRIAAGLFALSSRAIIQSGLLVLLLTPVARVVFSVIAFWRQRDRTFVAITLAVLAVLVCNLVRRG
jgi:uncharacterized membrane protein